MCWNVEWFSLLDNPVVNCFPCFRLFCVETDYDLEQEGRLAETAIPNIQPNGNMYTAYVDRGLQRLDKYEELRSRVDTGKVSPELFVQMTPSVRRCVFVAVVVVLVVGRSGGFCRLSMYLRGRS